MSPEPNPIEGSAILTEHDRLLRIEIKLDQLCDGQNRMNKHLTGDDKPNDGLIVRVDRLEQGTARQQWWTRTIIGGLIAAIITSISSVLVAIFK